MLFYFLRNPLNYLALAAYCLVFAIGYERKPHYRLRMAVIVPIFTVASLAMFYLYPKASDGILADLTIIFFYCLHILFGVATVFFLYQVRKSTALFIASSAYVVVDFGSNIFQVMQTDHSLGPVLAQMPFNFLTLLLIRVAVGAVTFAVIGRKLRRNPVDLDDRIMLRFSVLVVFFLLIMIRVSTHVSDVSGIPFFLASLNNALYRNICNILILFIQYSLILRAKSTERIQGLNYVVTQSRDQSQRSKEAEQELRILAHDMKNRQLLYKLSESSAAEDFDSQVHSGNRVVDVILQEKIGVCQSLDIEMSVIADGKALSFMDPSDLCALLGNALDNAIEACRSTQEKSISFYVKSRGGMVSVHIANSKPPRPLALREDALPETTKQEKNLHGYGMMSMRSIVEKYDGMLSFKDEENLFVLNMLFTPSN